MSQDPGQPRPDADRLAVPAFGLEALEPRLLLSASLVDLQQPLLPAGSFQDEVTAQAVGDRVLGIDVSQFQNTINWNSVAASGREFAFIRAIDRFGNVDTRFFNNIQGATNAGILAGAYQFVTPWTDGFNDAVQEATQFANLIKPYLADGFLRPVIDIEAGPPLTPTPMQLDNTVLTNWVHDYMATFIELTGVEPIIYANTDHALNAFNSSINVYDLWLANWTGDPDIPPPQSNPDGVWNGYDLWQYSGGGDSVPGISGGVDGDVFLGTIEELVAKYGIVIPADDHGGALADATALQLPSTALGNVDTIMDQDWFAVTLANGRAYTFSLAGGTLDAAEFALYSETGTLIASTSGPGPDGLLGQLLFTPLVGGTYHLSVTGAGIELGTYALSVHETDDHGDSIAEATELVGGFTLGGIQFNGDADFFHFNAQAGKQYDFSVIGFGVPDAVLTLFNADGSIVSQQAGSNPGGTHAQLTWTAAADADMFLSISAAPGSSGGYVLSLTVSDAPALLTGDLDGDGFVGIADLNIVLGNWNQNVTAGDLLQGDPSGDGFVGIGDLNVVLGNWNAGTPPLAQAVQASPSAVTSPSAPPQAQVTEVADSEPAPFVNNGVNPGFGLAIANARSESRSAFGPDKRTGYTPAFGLWEPDEVLRSALG